MKLRGCSYGVELAQLDGLARLGEISPSLRNSYKNIMGSHEKHASPPRWDLTWFCRDPTKAKWKFFVWTRVSGPARQGGIEIYLISFVLFFRSWLNNIRTFVHAEHGFTSQFIIKTSWSKNQRRNELCDWTETEDSIWTWDKNHLT